MSMNIDTQRLSARKNTGIYSTSTYAANTAGTNPHLHLSYWKPFTAYETSGSSMSTNVIIPYTLSSRFPPGYAAAYIMNGTAAVHTPAAFISFRPPESITDSPPMSGIRSSDAVRSGAPSSLTLDSTLKIYGSTAAPAAAIPRSVYSVPVRKYLSRLRG